MVEKDEALFPSPLHVGEDISYFSDKLIRLQRDIRSFNMKLKQEVLEISMLKSPQIYIGELTQVIISFCNKLSKRKLSLTLLVKE